VVIVNWKPFLYKWHKWSAVAAGLLTLIWFGSGVVMMLPSPLFGSKAEPRDTSERLDFRQATVTVPEAIAALEAATGQPAQVTGVSLRQFRGRLLYSLSTRGANSHLIDAISGAPFVITEAIAREIALSAVSSSASLGPATKIEESDSDYRWGPLPAYRFPVGDAAGTAIYVAIQTGEVRSTDRPGRIRGFLAGTHTLEFLRPMLPSRIVKLLMLVVSLIGVGMTMLGSAILWLQFRNWWQSRWRTS
jgi:hypothetical protein